MAGVPERRIVPDAAIETPRKLVERIEVVCLLHGAGSVQDAWAGSKPNAARIAVLARLDADEASLQKAPMPPVGGGA